MPETDPGPEDRVVEKAPALSCPHPLGREWPVSSRAVWPPRAPYCRALLCCPFSSTDIPAMPGLRSLRAAPSHPAPARTPVPAPPAEHSLLPPSTWLRQLLLLQEIAQKLNCHSVQKGSDRRYREFQLFQWASAWMVKSAEQEAVIGTDCVLSTCRLPLENVPILGTISNRDFLGSQTRACARPESAHVNLSHVGL